MNVQSGRLFLTRHVVEFILCNGDNMLIDSITGFCHNRYTSQECSECTHAEHCPNDCGKCLEYVHFPDRSPVPRTYNCMRMADYYVCKYAHRYTSEMIYALENMQDICCKPLKVMSVGCGPCTDLFAVDYMQNQGKISSIDYIGIDLNAVWEQIHSDIKQNAGNNKKIQFYCQDVFDFIDDAILDNWLPDLITFQYVFSDMQRSSSVTNEIKSFIEKFAIFAEKLLPNSYIAINDINLSVSRGGERDYFDEVSDKTEKSSSRKFHFVNNSRSYFPYGMQYASNALKVFSSDNLSGYAPFKTCSSAQILIKRQGW